MRKVFVILVVFLFLWSGSAFAVPKLQLDISGGTYDSSTETIEGQSDSFTLYAILTVDGEGSGTALLTDYYYITMALNPGVDGAADLGSFDFDITTYNVTADMTFGLPDVPEHGNGSLPPHGVFNTYYLEDKFQFDSGDTVGTYNTADDTGQFSTYSSGSGSYFAAFNVDVTELTDPYSIHFDLHNNAVFAPFSHDAQSGPNPIPEPATMLLLGTGLIGLAGFRRKKFKN